MFPDLTVHDRDELLSTLGTAVIAAGLARDDYVAGLKARELEFPTGLPISGGVALPHTSAEYVMGNTIVCASLTHPVVFNEMGGDKDSEVPVSTVLMLVVADATQQVKVLSSLIRKLQDGVLTQQLHDAASPQAMAALLSESFPAGA